MDLSSLDDLLQRDGSDSASTPTNSYKALYDYEAAEAHILSFKMGETLTLISKAAHPWWECLLRDTKGLVPFNYLAPLAAAGESDAGSLRSHSDSQPSDDATVLDDGAHEDLTDDEEDALAVAAAVAAVAVASASTPPPARRSMTLSSPAVTHSRVATASNSSSSAPSTPPDSGASSPSWTAQRQRSAPSSAKVPTTKPRSRSFLGSRMHDEVPPATAAAAASASESPSKRGHERRSSTAKGLFARRGSTRDSSHSGDASSEPSPKSSLRASARARSRASSSATPQLFGLPLQVVMPRGHSPPVFLVRLLATLEASRGIETPGIFLSKRPADELAPLKARLNLGDVSCITASTDPHVLAGVLQEWLECLPLSLIPADMYNLVCEAEKIHNDDEHFFHCVHTLIHSMPKAHRVALQYVCYIFKNAVAHAERNGTTLDKLADVMAPVLLRPREGTAQLVINQAGGTARMQRFTTTLRNVDITTLHIDELPPIESAAADAATAALLQAELERRAHVVVFGARVVRVLIQRFGEMFMNEGSQMRFTNKPGVDARDCISAGTVAVVVHKLMDKNYVDLLDPEFPLIVMQLRDYFIPDDVQMLQLLRGVYMRHRDSHIPWEEAIRLRVLNTLKLWMDTCIPEDRIVPASFAAAWEAFKAELGTETSLYQRTVLLSAGSVEATTVQALKAQSLAAYSGTIKNVKGLCTLSPKTDLLELATCLTLVSSERFTSIAPIELMHRNWQTKALSPNYTALVEDFALYQGWAVHQILTADDRDRARVAGQVVELAHRCLELNNFHVCFALYAGAAHPSVSRLNMWDKLARVKERLAVLEALFDPSLNHKAYQSALKAATPPVVPQLSIYSKYLFAIEENNEDWMDARPPPGSTAHGADATATAAAAAETAPTGAGKMVNIQKLRMLFLIIRQLRQFQRVPYYHLAPSILKCQELYALVRGNKLPALEEKAMYDTSLKIQPRV